MTDRKQFEAMLEALINEDQETAKEIFHNIVVAKSRDIYEELLSEDFDLEETQDEEDKKEEDEVEESFEEAAEEEEEGGEEEGEGDIGGDATDDMIGDVTDGAEEDEDMSDEEQTDRILDLEDALEELKAEFEQLMAGEENEPEHADMFGGDEMGAEFGGEEETDEMMPVMEYKHKVTAKMGDDGANAKSVVAGKNDMGGTTANITKGGTADGDGKAMSPKEDNAGNVNVPGGNKAKLSPVSGGHGAEKKGKGESADNKKSTIGSR